MRQASIGLLQIFVLPRFSTFHDAVSASALLGLLLISHHLELVHLLQLGDLEGAVGLAGLHLEVVDLHVPLLDGVLHVELLAEDGAALVVKLLHKGGQVVLREGQDHLVCNYSLRFL